MNTCPGLRWRLLVCLAWLAAGPPAAALDPVPEAFARQVQAGWLPASCAPLRSRRAPRPIVRRWVTARAGPRVTVLFIVPSPWFPDPHQAEAQAIAGSLDLDGDIIPLANARQPDKQNDEAMNLLRYRLATRRYDVIALSGAWLAALPADCAARIAELVRQEGVGFVHSVPGAPPEGAPEWSALDALLPAPVEPRLKSWQAVPAAEAPLAAGSDFSALRWVCDVDAAAAPESTVLLHAERPERVLAAAAVRGRGRVVSLNCSLEEMVYGRPFCPPVMAPFLPEEQTGKYCRWLQGTECADQFYAWLGRALLWAAHREPPVAIREARVAPDGRGVEVVIANGSAEPRPCVVRVLLRSPANTVTRAAETACTLAPGQTVSRQLALPSTGYAGRHQLDLQLLDDRRRTWDGWCAAVDIAGPAVSLPPDFALHTPTDVVRPAVKVQGVAPGQPFTVRTELFDLDGRLLWDQRSGADVAVDLSRTGITTTLANLRVTVTAAGISAEARDQLFVRQEPHWDAFHIMAYDGYYEEPFGFAVRAAALKSMGHDVILASWPSPHRMRVDTETGLRVVPNNLAPSCGYQPDALAHVTAWLRRFSPLLYELQDEPELQYTAASEAPFDGPADMLRFRTFLQAQYGTLEALNAAWGTEAAARRAAGPGFEVVATLPAEARFKLDPGDVGTAEQWFAPALDETGWETLRTGATWEQQGHAYDGCAWYRIRFTVPELSRGRPLRLAFGGVDEEAWVYLNGQPLGERSVASTAKAVAELWDKSFELPLPDDLLPGRENLVAVRVRDQAAAGGIYKPITLLAPPLPTFAQPGARGYAEWAEVQRFQWHEVLDSGNWAPWFDSRRDLDRSFVEKFGACADAVHRLEPDRAASVNFRGVETFSGVDLRAFTRRLGAASLYTDFVRDAGSAASLSFLGLGARWAAPAMSCIGYSAPPLAELQGRRIAHEAWDAVRHGVKLIAWFLPSDFLSQDLTPNAEGRVIAALNRTLQAGPGPLAAVTAPLREGVFVYTPRSLFYTDTLACLQRRLKELPGAKPAELKGLGPFEDQIPNGFVPHLRALSYQFEFGDEDDLTAERLRSTRVVLLSHVICLGERELGLLGEFVRRGGCVVAEAGTGRRDGAGRLYAETPQSFRELFGVRRPSPNPSPGVAPDGVAAAGARKLDWIPAVLGSGYQSGKALYLDFAVPRTVPGYQVVKRALESAGIRPTFALRNNRLPDGPPVTVDLYGVAFSISNGLAASLAARQLGPVTYLYLTGDRPAGRAPFDIALPGRRFVHELVTGADLGALSAIKGTIAYGEARVFALSPARVTAFTARPGSGRYRLGERLRVRFSVAVAEGAAGDRLIRLEYRGPEKGARPALPHTLVLRGGSGELSAVLPLNAMPGPASIRARDLASGKECAAALVIARPGG